MSTETMKDYERANAEAKALFDSLDITTATSEPQGELRDDAWPCIAYLLTFWRAKVSISVPYRVGVGHVNWAGESSIGLQRDIEARDALDFLSRKPHAQLKDKGSVARAASFLAKRQKVAPKPYEVLACYCSEAKEAAQTTFEDWASNMGLDTDSRKAEAMFHACREPYGKLVQMLGSVNVDKLAELHSQF